MMCPELGEKLEHSLMYISNSPEHRLATHLEQARNNVKLFQSKQCFSFQRSRDNEKVSKIDFGNNDDCWFK